MNTILRGALAAACVLAFAAPAALAKPGSLGLRSDARTCDGPGTYRQLVSWQGAPNATYYVNTGNGCRGPAKACGVGPNYCIAQCSKAGDCRVELRQCGVARVQSWVRVRSTANLRIDDETKPTPPGRCG